MKVRIESLTGVRFLAAFIVLIGHLVGHTKFKAIHDMGPISVQIFFILSGFVIYISYADKLNLFTFKKFILLRIARLYPSYILTLILAIFIYRDLPSDIIIKNFLIDSTMTQSWWGIKALAFPPFDGPIWSVSTEFMFYILFFVSYNIFIKSNLKTIIMYFTVYILIWLFIIHSYSSSSHSDDLFVWISYVNPYYRFYEFCMGCFAAILYKKKYEQIDSIIGKHFFKVSILEVFLLCVLFSIPFYKSPDENWYILNIMSIISFFTIFILAFNRGAISKMFSTKVFILLGESSYVLYLIHVPIFTELQKYFTQYGINNIVEKLLLIFVPILFSLFIFKYIEKPVNSFLRKRIL